MHRVLDGLAQALRHLHEGPKLIHGDLKLSNIKIVLGFNSEPQAKLLDFGLARAKEFGTTVIGKTRLWAAPEVRPKKSRLLSEVLEQGFSEKEIDKVKHDMPKETHCPLDFDSNDRFTSARVALLEPMLNVVNPDSRPAIKEVHQDLRLLAELEGGSSGPSPSLSDTAISL
ncbi:unnamed protein product [Polarella glacialis]|uniref:Protein kinase domain-containing protein n=1 Tax=Polarella glacialis TaxID=89957 RepID=A0A813DGR9_POLGL|nr:unnamed protein product [Polarella glacialis]